MLPSPDWERLARYMISRSLVHGKRRAEEMREVAKTVKEARVEPWMSAAAAERQDWAAEQAQRMPPEALEEQDLQVLLDAILKAMMAEAVAPSQASGRERQYRSSGLGVGRAGRRKPARSSPPSPVPPMPMEVSKLVDGVALRRAGAAARVRRGWRWPAGAAGRGS